MRQVIHKHPLWHGGTPVEVVEIKMHRYATLLSLGVQDNIMIVWERHSALSVETEIRKFGIVGTGAEHDFAPGTREHYLGTAEIERYMWHVFELVRY